MKVLFRRKKKIKNYHRNEHSDGTSEKLFIAFLTISMIDSAAKLTERIPLDERDVRMHVPV